MGIDPGAFLRGLTRGMLAAQEMRERREATAERKSSLKRDFLLRVSQGLSGIDDPDTFNQALEQFRGLAPQFGADPAEIVWTFPESKRKKIKAERASAALDSLIKNNRFLEDATYTIDGEQISGRALLTLAGVPRGTRKVTEPITEEIKVPVSTEDFVARHFGEMRPQQIVVGTREREEEIPFTTPRRITLGEYDPVTFAKHPHLARLPVPLDKDGNLDTTKLLDIYGKVVPNPVDAAKAATDRVDKDRSDFNTRLGRIQQQMSQADTPEQFRVAVQAYNALVNDFRRFKPWVGVKELPMDAARAVSEWVKENARRGRDADGSIGPPIDVGPQGRLDVHPIRNKRGIVTHYAINGRQYTVPQAEAEAERRILAGEDRRLATALGWSPQRIEKVKGKATGVGAERQQLQRELQQVEKEMRQKGAEISVAGVADKPKLIRELQALTIRRLEILNRLRSRAAPTPPAIPGQQAVPEGAPTATNPQTGQRAYWDGERWVPIP